MLIQSMIMQKLKEETYEAHNELESTKLLSHFRDRSVTREIYILILKKFFAYFSQLETQLANFNDINNYLPDFNERRKAGLLLSDLKALNQIPFDDHTYITPKLPTLGAVFGSLYVMEGSTLGGRIISSVLSENLGIEPGKGGSFFFGYGAETGVKWKLFCQAMDAFSKEQNQDQLVVSGASETFLKLKNWLEA